MSLREEIKKEIDDILVLAETNNDNTNETTDNIVKLFEKRIDSLPNKPTGTYMMGYCKALNDVKEMLK